MSCIWRRLLVRQHGEARGKKGNGLEGGEMGHGVYGTVVGSLDCWEDQSSPKRSPEIANDDSHMTEE